MNVECAFFNPSLIKHHYLASKILIERKEYNIKNIILNIPSEDSAIRYEEAFTNIQSAFMYTQKLEDFIFRSCFLKLFFSKRFTATINMIFYAIAKGYRDIYVTGLDFFYLENVQKYAFDNNKSNLLKLLPNFNRKPFELTIHSKEIELQGINLACEMLGAKIMNVNFISVFNSSANKIGDGNIYSVSPNSILSEYLPLAPKLKNNISFNLKNKSNDHVQDIIIKKDAIKFRHIIKKFMPKVIWNILMCIYSSLRKSKIQ